MVQAVGRTAPFDDVTLYGEIVGVAASVVPKTIIDEKKTRRLFEWCFG
jgi:hypothetical protein